MAFSLEDVKGGIYYWKASGGATGDSAIMRFDFGNVAQTTAERFVGPEKAGGKCVGCHALSRRRQEDGRLRRRLGRRGHLARRRRDRHARRHAGSDRVRVVEPRRNEVRRRVQLHRLDEPRPAADRTMPARRLGTIPVGATAAQSTSHPDWSPDGSRIAFVRAGQAYESGVNNQRFYRGAIEMVEAQGASFGSADHGRPLAGGQEPLLPVVRARQQAARVRRVDLPDGQRAHRLQRGLRSDARRCS